jgi:hypothetical protein
MALANQRRSQNAKLRAAVNAGEIDGFLLLAGAYGPLEPVIARWYVETLVRMMPGIGKRRGFIAMAALHIDAEVRLEELSPEQRAALVDTLKHLAGGPGRRPKRQAKQQ